MTYRALLKKLQRLSQKELSQKVVLFYSDGGWYSEVTDVDKTEKEDETLGCKGIDSSSGWKKGQVYLSHSC